MQTIRIKNRSKRVVRSLTGFTLGFSLVQIFAVTNKLTNGEQTAASLTGVQLLFLQKNKKAQDQLHVFLNK